MAGVQGATQSGVPAQGDATPAKPVQRSARDEAMDAIFDKRLDGYETESGSKLDRGTTNEIKPSDDDIDPDDAVANAARKQLETQAATDAAKPAETVAKTDTDDANQPKLDANSQLEQQADGDELILDAATLAKAKVRIKVDGQEELVPASKALGQYQKNAAADVRLAEATRLQREAQVAAQKANDEAVERANNAATKTEKVEAQREVTRTKDALDAFKKASDALFDGDADKAAKLFADAVAAATQSTGRADGTTQNVDAAQVADAVEQRLTQKSALAQLFKDYPEIKADSDYASITDKYVNLYVQQGKSIADAIAEAGETVAEKFRLGKHKVSTGRPMKTDGPTTRAEKVTGKQNLDEVSASNARATETTAPEPTAVDIIAEIRKSRGQGL
jgi:hypothetical protein